MTHQINVNFNDFGPNGLRFYAYPKVLSILSYEHLKETDQGIGVLIKNKYAWAIISMKLTFSKPVKTLTSIFGNTWYSGQKGPYYRREFEVFFNDTIIKGASYSILLDVNSRTVFRGKKLPFEMLKEVNTFMVDIKTNYRLTHNYHVLSEAVVLHSHIDALGHVNHLKYMEFIYDALNTDLVDKVYSFNTMELFFQKEMVLGDTFSINYFEDSEKMVFMVYNNSKDETSFTLVLSNE